MSAPRWWYQGMRTPRVHALGFRFSCCFHPRDNWMIGARLIRDRRMSGDKWLLTIGLGPVFLLASHQSKDD